MNSANFEEVITCGICLETFNEDSKCPRILSCGHSFCHFCLEKLLAQSPSCPTCKAGIQFSASELIPINYVIKSMLNIKDEIVMPHTSVNLALERDNRESLTTKDQMLNKNRKFLSEGYCSEHSNFKEMRCMDCELWICGLCASLRHKHCRTLIVVEAYKELKKQVTKKVEIELCESKAIGKELNESLRILEDKRKYLKGEIKRKELELNDCEMHINELESLKSEENKFSNKLKQLQEMTERSANDLEFSKTMNELDKLLEIRKKSIPKDLQNHHLPKTRKALGTLCQNGPVYVVEDRFDVIRYGEVKVKKNGKIWVNNFQPEKPNAKLFIFKDLLLQFYKSTELPQTVFLQLTPEGGGVNSCGVIIETLGFSPRSKNFILLFSALKGTSFKGLTMVRSSSFYQLSQGPPPVVEGIKDDDKETAVCEAGVYGMGELSSWFQIVLNDAGYSCHKFGVVTAGLGSLKNRGGFFTVAECGLVI